MGEDLGEGDSIMIFPLTLTLSRQGEREGRSVSRRLIKK